MTATKEEFAKMVCLFLAEELRSKRIGLERAAEISQKVLDNINLVTSEAEFLSLAKELATDFEELVKLEDRMLRGRRIDERRRLEKEVAEFVAKNLGQNPSDSIKLMQTASAEEVTIQDLILKFPEFKKFHENSNVQP